MAKHLTGQLTRLVQSSEWSLCLADLLRCAVTSEVNTLRATAVAYRVLSDRTPLVNCVAPPCTDQLRQAVEALLRYHEGLPATSLAAAIPSQLLQVTASAANPLSSSVDASVVRPSAHEWLCVVTLLMATCAIRHSTDSVGARRAPLALTAPAVRPVAPLAGIYSPDAVVAAITYFRTVTRPWEIALDQSIVERARRRVATARRQQGGGLRRVRAGARGSSMGHALRIGRRDSPIPRWSHSWTCAARAGSTRAAASTFVPSFVDGEERSGSHSYESLPSSSPSSRPRQPRVTRRLAAAWQLACMESYRQAHVGYISNTAGRESSCIWACAAEEELRARFQRALRWRSDPAEQCAGDEAPVTEAELRSIAAFVVESYVSLQEKLERCHRQSDALVLATRASGVVSGLHWQLFVLLILVDEVCVTLSDSNACSTRTPNRNGGVTESSALHECIVLMASTQLCILGHSHFQRSMASVDGASTRHSEADVREASPAASHNAHALRATRRLVEGVVDLWAKEDEGVVLSPERTDTIDVCSPDSWLGRQICCLAEPTFSPLHEAQRHGDESGAVPLSPLLLLRLLVECTSWHGDCAADHVNSAQHLRHVGAAVLLIECVLARASKGKRVHYCVAKLRGALRLSPHFVCEDEQVGSTVRQRTPTPRPRAWCHSWSSHKGGRLHGETAALPAVTARFVCQVLDGCPPWMSRLLLLLPQSTPEGSRLTTDVPGTPLDLDVLAEELVLLAPGMAFSAAWRQRHTCAVKRMRCMSPTASAPTLKRADVRDVGASSGVASTSSGVVSPDFLEHNLPLRPRATLEQVYSRLCTSSAGTATVLLPAWWQALSSPFLSSIFSQLNPPAISRTVEAMLAMLRLLPPVESTVHHEECARARRSAGAVSPEAKADECGEAGKGAGVTEAPSSVRAIYCILASIPTDDARAEVSQMLLSRFCTAMTESARWGGDDNADLTTERVHGAGVCLAFFLACATTSAHDQAAATQHLLEAVTSVLNGRWHGQHRRRGSGSVYAALRTWWPGAMGSIMLLRHAQLAQEASPYESSASKEPGSAEEPQRSSLVSLSPALHLAVWWEGQSGLQAASDAPELCLGDSCHWKGMRIMRLCTTAAHLAAMPTITSTAFASQQQRSPLQASPTAAAEAARMACTAVYDMMSLEQMSHLALASATGGLSTRASQIPCVCALATAEAGVSRFDGYRRCGDRATSIFTHAMTAAPQSGGRALNILQHRHGRLLTDQQHASLVEAMHEFSKQRSVKQALALFYAHERKNRRLRLGEVQLFAETAKRAPLSFLVRLLLYVPPPCQSAVLARAIITGAWKAYQRARHPNSRQIEAATAERHRGCHLENAPLASDVRRRSCRRLEQAWYESVAVARRALALLPSAGGGDGCGEEEQHRTFSILQRLICARPRSLRTSASPRRGSSSSTDASVCADEWDSDAVQSDQMLAALLRSSSRSSHWLHVLQSASAHRSVEELCQVIEFCDANSDSATAVRAYLRFANARVTSSARTHASSTPAHDVLKRRDSTVDTNGAWAMPLLPLDICVPLLRLASMYVVAACDDDAATYGVSMTSSRSTRVSLTALVAYAEAHEMPSELSVREAPREGAALMPHSLGSRAVAEDAEMAILLRTRAALEEGDAAASNIAAEDANESAGVTSKQVSDAMVRKSGSDAHVKGTPVSAFTAAAAATSRSTAYAMNCIAAVQRLSWALPASLRCVMHADSAFIPLVAVLQDALRWCPLRPRSTPAREGAATATDGLAAAAHDSLAACADSDEPATVDIVTRLLAAVFRLDGAETVEMVDAARPRPLPSLVMSAPQTVRDINVAPAMADVAGGDATSSMMVIRHSFVCRVARANQDFWHLVRHSHTLLSYVWDYLWELYRLEVTVLWVSPAQQQRAYLAVAECAQVIVAALQALDVWAAEMRAHEARVRVNSGDDNHQVHHQNCLTGTRSGAPMSTSLEWSLRSSVDKWRAELRSGILRRLHARLFAEDGLSDVTGSRRGETVPAMSSCCLTAFGVEDPTSAAIAYVAAVIRHRSRAFESCAPTNLLMQRAVDPIAATSPEAFDKPPSRSLMGGESATPPREARQLLWGTTKQYYDALRQLLSISLPMSGGAGSGMPAHLSRLAMENLSYVLRCVTATAAAPPARCPHTISTVTESEADAITALLSRMAAADGMLRHIASLVLHASVLMEAMEAAPRTPNAELLRTLWCLSSALQYAAVLVDECMAWWTLLDLEAAAAADAAAASELLGDRGAPGGDVGNVFGSVNGSRVVNHALTHVRGQIQRLVASLAVLYVSGWCGRVHERLPEVIRARLWSRDESRAQHLRVCLVLQHYVTVSGDAAVPARLARATETLQHALTRYPSSLASSTETNDARALQLSGFADFNALVDGKGRGGTELEDCTAAAAMQTLERTLLAYLTLSKRADGMVMIPPDQMTVVSITALEASLQRAVMARLSPTHVALLERLLPALLDDGCHTSAALEATPREGSDEVPQPTWCRGDTATDRSLGATCTVATALWRQLLRLGKESKSETASDVTRSDDDHTEIPALHGERLAVHAALLSRNALVMMGVVRHPLLRHYHLAEARRAQWRQVQGGAGSDGSVSATQAPPCEWLKKLLLYAAEPDPVAERREASSDEADESALSSAWMAAGSTLRHRGGGELFCTSSSGPLALLSAQPLRERFVSALTLAVLRDTSLMCEGPTCTHIASAPKPVDGDTTAALSPSLCSPFVSSSVVAAVAAQRRECMLLELMQHLSYVAPHAVYTAARWITGTPYPPDACAQVSSFPAEALPQAKLNCSMLSCTDVTTLRRLRVALLSCGPWPVHAARTLLEYATRVQRAATEAAAHAGDGLRATMPFPEAVALYEQLQQKQRESTRHGIAETPCALMVTARHQVDAVHNVRSPLLPCVLQHDGGGPAAFTSRAHSSSAPVWSSTTDTVCTAHARGGSFTAVSSPLSPFAPVTPNFPVTSTRHGQCTGTGGALSAIQLACEEGARLVKAIGTSTAPAVRDAAARMVLRMHDLATAPSHSACVDLLSDAAFSAEVMALPTKHVAAVMMLFWQTLLVRTTELDCCQQNWSSAGDNDGVVVAEAHNRTRNLPLREAVCRTHDCVTVLDVYAVFCLLVSRMYDWVTAIASPVSQAKGQQWRTRGQRQLRCLKRELAAYWVAVLADDVMMRKPVFQCSTTSEADAICARIDAYCRSGADECALRSPTSDLVTLASQLRRAQARLPTVSQERSSETEGDKAAEELSRLQQELGTQLRDAGARLTLLPPSATAEHVSTLGRDDVQASPAQAWSLWPPAASETYRLRASLRKSSDENIVANTTVRNPLSVVTYVSAWKREHASAPPARQPNKRVARFRGESTEATTPRAYDVNGATCALLPTVCLPSSSEAQGSRQPRASRGSSRSISKRTAVSLTDIWRAVDAFVRRGCLGLACVPRGGHHKAPEGSPACCSDVDAMETNSLPEEVESPTAGISPVGAGVVMQTLLDLVSLEDARLQKEQQQSRRQHPRLPSHTILSGDMLHVLSVLRQLRQRLLPPLPGTAAMASGAHDREGTLTTVTADNQSTLASSVSPWASFTPLSCVCALRTRLTRLRDDLGPVRPGSPSLVPQPSGSMAWHSYLHVLHLCGDGLLDRVAHRRGRRNLSSAATLTCVAHQLQLLASLSTLAEQVADSPVLPALRSRLLNEQDAQRIICFQLRGLQRIRDHVCILGWSVEQHRELQLAQQSLLATVTAIGALQRRSHHGRQQRLRGEEACDVSATARIKLSAGVRSQGTAEMHESHVNHVEQATAACFYPALAHLLREISAASPSRTVAAEAARETFSSRLCSPAEDRVRCSGDSATEVVTTFAGAAAAARRRRRLLCPRPLQTTATTTTAESNNAASALLATVYGALSEAHEQKRSGSTHRPQKIDDGHTSMASAATPTDPFCELHALLSAIVAAVQRRSRDTDPLLLLEFLNGKECEALLPLAAACRSLLPGDAHEGRGPWRICILVQPECAPYSGGWSDPVRSPAPVAATLCIHAGDVCNRGGAEPCHTGPTAAGGPRGQGKRWNNCEVVCDVLRLSRGGCTRQPTAPSAVGAVVGPLYRPPRGHLQPATEPAQRKGLAPRRRGQRAQRSQCPAGGCKRAAVANPQCVERDVREGRGRGASRVDVRVRVRPCCSRVVYCGVRSGRRAWQLGAHVREMHDTWGHRNGPREDSCVQRCSRYRGPLPRSAAGSRRRRQWSWGN
ncbi:hypothetical protein, conserved [Leishmania tarentolae]|uniref:Uncharacterized protein n=1 Tax=Leishmania tarentolae TaxID=5689 RepID=A0A640KAK0_LEITA|nr:hypothetical protein, conserved [Leishmania tarentolae]